MIFDLIRQASYTMPARYRIAGTVAEEGSPVQKRIAIFTRSDLHFYASILSEPDGTWEIPGLPESLNGSEFIVLGIDDTGQYNAVVADKIIAVS